MTVLLDPGSRPAPLLHRRGTAPALVHDGRVTTYAELDDRVQDLVARLGPHRKLVVLQAAHDVETVVGYLAALAGHHPVLLTPRCRPPEEVLATYAPDVVLSGGDVLEHTDRGAPGRHELHPDLALLLSTSGTTGSPKLVRLSRENLTSNAASIATYLGLGADDCGVTALPLHYCYGLSVLNSHLHAGAPVVLTHASVTDDALWDDVVRHGVTSLAGVPHTFDLLDATGFADRDLGRLRLLTAAGGRLAPERVRAYAALGRRRGFDLVVMYGQTEATARMAYLPPHLATERAECIGVPIPGGDLRVLDERGREVADGTVGELAYDGPNVMLGYASSPADLALGRTVTTLRTGDLARRHDDGLLEVVGRSSRFAKVFGLRVDLDRLEDLGESGGTPLRAVEHDGRVALFVRQHAQVPGARDVATGCGLPPTGVEVHVVAEFPLTSSGKTDRQALLRHAALVSRPAAIEGPVTAEAVRDLLGELLGRPDATVGDSFTRLHGDSLSFVEVSVRLGELLGDVPRDWPTLSASELARNARPARSWRTRWPRVDTSVVLRAAAIVLVVGSHANLLTVLGGAHVLLAVAGWHLARFQLDAPGRLARVRGILRSAARVAVPAGLFIAAAGAVTGMYDASTALFLNAALGAETWDVRWQFWFLEAVLWAMAGTALLLCVPGLDRLERARPFGFALGVLAATAGLRYALVGVEADIPERYALPVVLWCVALGWVAARAVAPSQRLLVSGLALGLTAGFFADTGRELLVSGAVLLLVWLPQVRLPRVLLRPLGVVAAASLWVYLTHWQVYPHLEVDHPLLATLASFAVGTAAWALVHATGRWATTSTRLVLTPRPRRPGSS